MDRNFRPRALGEMAIRCADITRMMAFYEDVIGLERLSGGHRGGIVFYRIADGFDGHISVLALFADDAAQADGHPKDKDTAQTGADSSLHHLALSLPFAEQQAVIDWYEHLGLDYRIETFPWIGWRGIFTEDPEGNTVELVAYDATMKGA